MSVDYRVFYCSPSSYKEWVERTSSFDEVSNERDACYEERESFIEDLPFGDQFADTGMEFNQSKSAVSGEKPFEPGFLKKVMGSLGNKDALKLIEFGNIVYWSFTDGEPVNEHSLSGDQIGLGVDVDLGPEAIRRCLKTIEGIRVGYAKQYLASKNINLNLINGQLIMEWERALNNALKSKRDIIVEVPI